MKKILPIILAFIFLIFAFVLFCEIASQPQNVDIAKPILQEPLPEVVQEKAEYEMLESNILSEVEAENDASTFPALWGDYTKYLGFDSYIKEMEKSGCCLFFFNKAKNIFEKIDYTNGKSEEFPIAKFATKWGNTPAQISGEKSLAKFIDRSDTEIFLAKPLAMEKNIESVVRAYLNSKQIKIKDILTIRGVYLIDGGSFCLRVYEILYRDSSFEKVEIKILL